MTARADARLERARAFIDTHYTRSLTVQGLAGQAGLSAFHFIRAFRAAYDVTPYQYVRRRRLARACELLVTTPLPVTEVCDRVGFRSLGSFSALFRREIGETPRQYRAARRKSVYIPACFVRMFRAERAGAISKKRTSGRAAIVPGRRSS